MRLLAVAIIALCACKGEQAQPTPQPTIPGGSSHAPTPATGPVTEIEARAIGEQVATAVTPCDASTIGPLLVEANDNDIVCAWMRGIDSYHLVGIRTFEGEPRPLMRRLLIDPSGGLHVNYDQLKLQRKDGKVLLRDVYSYRQGRWLSESLVDSPVSPDVTKAKDLLHTGKLDEAMALVDKLPLATRRDLLLRAFTGAGLDPAQSKQALADLAKEFPDDPVLALTEIDGAFDSDDYDKMIHWCDVLEKEIGPDAYLASQRAIAYLKKRDLPHALEQANAAIKQEPTLTHAHQVKLDILIEMKSWPEVLAEMTELEKNHGVHFDEASLRAEPRLAELVSSPAFAQWLGSR